MHWEAEPFYWLGNLARKLRGNHCGKFSDNKIHCVRSVRSVRIIVAISWRCDCAATLLYFIVQPDPEPDNQFFCPGAIFRSQIARFCCAAGGSLSPPPSQ